MNKRTLIDLALQQLEEEIQRLTQSARETTKGATHEESRAENDKDTRGLEASYLARGQAMRVEDTVEAQTKLRFMELKAYSDEARIGLGALVTVEVDESSQCLFIAVAAGGLRVDVEGTEVCFVTPASPIGRALLGKEVGDELTLTIAGKRREYEVVDLA